MQEECELVKQGFKPGKCVVHGVEKSGRACEITLKYKNNIPYRLIKSFHLSRPEHYLSIYQSGCNLECLKCHSWKFTQYANGIWLSPLDILNIAKEYSQMITYYEPRERATSFHALEICRGCGVCIEIEKLGFVEKGEIREEFYLKPSGKRGKLCPGKLKPEQIVLSPQGFGPARNIIAFTGGDIACKPDFYARCAEKIKEENLPLWILFETNGYGLTPKNLDIFKKSGIDSFWLDIKAYDPEIHKKLTGVTNEWILKLPEEILKRDFVLEVLTLYIPGWVEEEQIKKIAEIISKIDKKIPFTILAFFPEYRMKETPSPTLEQMLRAYREVRETGLENVKLGNIGTFVKNEEEMEILLREAKEAI